MPWGTQSRCWMWGYLSGCIKSSRGADHPVGGILHPWEKPSRQVAAERAREESAAKLATERAAWESVRAALLDKSTIEIGSEEGTDSSKEGESSRWERKRIGRDCWDDAISFRTLDGGKSRIESSKGTSLQTTDRAEWTESTDSYHARDASLCLVSVHWCN